MFAEHTNAVPHGIEEFALGEPEEQAVQQHCCQTASGPWPQQLPGRIRTRHGYLCMAVTSAGDFSLSKDVYVLSMSVDDHF